MKPLLQQWPEAFAARYRAAGYWTGDTFNQLLSRQVASHGDRVAVVGGNIRQTVDDLH